MAARSPTLERPTGAGPPSPEALFREARRRRRRRWSLALAGCAIAALVAGVAYGVSGSTGAPTGSATPPASPTSVPTAWRSVGTALFEHSGPGNYSGFTPTTTITCAGRAATTCYLAVHANGVLPDGELSTPGKWGAGPTDFVSSEFVSTDHGRTWRPLDLPDQAWTSTAFSCAAPQDCAVGALVGTHNGQGSFIRPAAVVVVTRDGGRTWALERLPASAGLVREVDCTTVESCMAVTWTPTATRVRGMRTNVGAGRVFPSKLYATQDAGHSWAAIRIPKPPAGDVYTLRSLTCSTASRCILTGFRTRVERAPAGYTSIHHVHTYLTTHGRTVVVAVHIRARTASVELRPSGPVSCVADHCLMVRTRPRAGRSPTPVLLVSTDGGRSWAKLASHGLPAYSSSLVCVSAARCFLTTGGTMTNDGGRHWSGTEVNHVSCTASGDCVGLQTITVRDPYVPTGMTATVSATRVMTNSPR
ncbi:MAG: hypothetical protein ACRDWE_02560 [Acidimicrobiales bacterium]